MRAISAQSIATGKSLELAQQECVKTAEARAKIISLSDPEYPSRLKEIYDPPVVLFVKGSIEVLARPASRWWERVIPRPTAAAWPSVSPPTSPLADW
jgi:hypothetical protein